MSTTAPEYLTTLRDGWTAAMQQWLDQSGTAWDQWAQAWSGGAMPRMPGMPGSPAAMPGRYRDKPGRRLAYRGVRCGCGPDHGCCRDACECCVPEADVIVHARAGEVRVVAFRLTNPWRREREVVLEVGPWHGCSGEELDIRASLEEEKLVLAPCEDRVVRLVVSLRSGMDRTAGGGADTQQGPEEKENDAGRAALHSTNAIGRGDRDLHECASAYADVRFEGCARPQRVAVVVSPADCDAVDTCCDCGCC